MADGEPEVRLLQCQPRRIRVALTLVTVALALWVGLWVAGPSGMGGGSILDRLVAIPAWLVMALPLLHVWNARISVAGGVLTHTNWRRADFRVPLAPGLRIERRLAGGAVYAVVSPERSHGRYFVCSDDRGLLDLMGSVGVEVVDRQGRPIEPR